MIVNSSSSIRHTYQQLFIFYRGNPAIFCCSTPNLFVHWKVMLLWVYYICYGIKNLVWAQIL